MEKIPVTPASHEEMIRKYPITGLVPGWYFRMEEKAPSVWNVEGQDAYGRKISRSAVVDEERALRECVAYAREVVVAGRLVMIITDALNRSMSALEREGAIDTKKLRKQYKGIGSKYYDMVTEQIELTVKPGARWICDIFSEENSKPKTR